MTRKLMIAACALAAVAFTGCQDQRSNAQDRLEKEQEKLSRTTQSSQEEVQKAEAEAQKKVADARTEAQKDVQEQEQDVAQDQRELAQSEQQEQVAANDETAMGGSGAAGTALQGAVTQASDSALTLRPASGQEVQVQVDQNTRVVGHDGKSLALKDIKQGDEVRASYEMRNGTNYATEVTVAHEKSMLDKAGDKTKDVWDDTKKGAHDLDQDIDSHIK